MAPSLCAERPFAGLSSLRVQPCFEPLERRELLSVTQPMEPGSDDTQIFVVPAEPTSVVRSDDPALFDWELWLDLFAEPDPNLASDPTYAEPLPIIPLDESIDPFVDCPGLDDDFCLPRDGESKSGFEDFLRLRENFGRDHATREDGDLDGDGFVTFGDFLIFSQNYG